MTSFKGLYELNDKIQKRIADGYKGTGGETALQYPNGVGSVPGKSIFYANPSEDVAFQTGALWNTDLGDPEDANMATKAFLARFGVNAALRKNGDMINTIKAPERVVGLINDAYELIASRLTADYRRVYDSLIRLGLSDEEAKARADAYIVPILQSELKLLKVQFPFSFGKGGGKGGQMGGIKKSLKLRNREKTDVANAVTSQLS